jgi:Lrp/AsnC family transcriptional regulator for asnA, asnC and gidA
MMEKLRISQPIVDFFCEIQYNEIMLDEKDRAIISILQYDGRTPFTKIADELNITEGSVRHRVKRLTASRKLQIVGIAQPEAMGFSEAGIIGITVQADLTKEVAEAIAQLPEVSYLVQAAGEFDLLAEVYCRDKDHFVSFLNNSLQKIPGVDRTQSFLILKMYKLSSRWGEAESLPEEIIST